MLSNTPLKNGLHKSLSCKMFMYVECRMLPFTILTSSIMPSFFLSLTKSCKYR